MNELIDIDILWAILFNFLHCSATACEVLVEARTAGLSSQRPVRAHELGAFPADLRVMGWTAVLEQSASLTFFSLSFRNFSPCNLTLCPWLGPRYTKCTDVNTMVLLKFS